MGHINHRRGDTRRRTKIYRASNHYWFGWWNDYANRYLRAATRQQLRALAASGYEHSEEVVWKIAREIDDIWNYD